MIVARFLALLELFCESAVAFDQAEALGELMVRWTGLDEGEIGVSDEFDESDVSDVSDESDESDGDRLIGDEDAENDGTVDQVE